MIKYIFTILCLLAVSIHLDAQSRTIIDDLNTTKAGQGKIVIYQDESISKLVGANLIAGTVTNSAAIANQLSTEGVEGAKNFVRAKGYRIQVYSGSDQRTAKNEANYRKSTIQSSYPNMEVTVTYNSPIWRVRAGNFKTQDQANEALTEMKSKFPNFKEMRVIEDAVKIPVE